MTDAAPDSSAPEGGPAPLRGRFVQVALNLPLRREFTYALPDGVEAEPGNRVRVHFHGRKLGGVVTPVSDTSDLDPRRIKPIEAVLDSELSLPPSLLELARVMADSYGCSIGKALDATLLLRPSGSEGDGPTREVDCRPSDAIALAVQTGAPIHVAREVFEAVAVD